MRTDTLMLVNDDKLRELAERVRAARAAVDEERGVDAAVILSDLEYELGHLVDRYSKAQR